MADRLIELLYESNVRCDIGIESLAEDIRSIFADVQRVKRGEWGKRAYNRVQCSYCGKCEDIATDFCPNCGADMREPTK